MLQRKQAMVYARALVVGFETNNLANIVCFADAFGSPRLRSGGISEYDLGKEFKINVKQQNGSVDGATYSSTSHGSHFHPYMQTYQAGPTFQPPYQGYPFPGMVVPPYYQRNLPWPPDVEDSKHRGKLSHMKESQDDNFDSSDSSSESDSGSDDLVRSVENKHEEKMITQQRNIFPNRLIKDANENESKKVTKRSNDWDSLNGNKNRVGNLRSTDDVSPVIKRPNTFKEELVSHKFKEPDTIPSVTTKFKRNRHLLKTLSESAERYKRCT
ncbi:hypothetical protein Tco_0715402 [Tanacetum coccineum]